MILAETFQLQLNLFWFEFKFILLNLDIFNFQMTLLKFEKCLLKSKTIIN